MTDINFIEQLVDAMEEAVSRLETAISQEKSDEANKLRTFIFDVHKKIEGELPR